MNEAVLDRIMKKREIWCTVKVRTDKMTSTTP